MFGLTTALFSVVGGFLGWIKSYMDKKLDAQIAKEQALYERAGLEMKARENVLNSTSKEIQFTRRIIVITLTALIVYIVLYAIHNPDATMFTVVMETKGGFFSFFLPFLSGEEVHYYEIPLTLVVGPIFDVYVGLVSFYIGSGGTQRWR